MNSPPIIRPLSVSFCIILVVFTGCSVYHPHLVDIPLISEKKEARLDAGISTLALAFGTFTYGLTKNIAVQAFGSRGEEVEYHLQMAAGYFSQFREGRVWEVYGGYGFGYGDAYYDPNPGTLKGNYKLYFLQINLGRKDWTKANIDYGAGIRTGYLHTDMTDYSYYGRYPVNTSYRVIDNSIAVEPGIFLRLGWEKFKLSLKAGACFIYKFTNRDKWLPYNMINFGIGFNHRF